MGVTERASNIITSETLRAWRVACEAGRTRHSSCVPCSWGVACLDINAGSEAGQAACQTQAQQIIFALASAYAAFGVNSSQDVLVRLALVLSLMATLCKCDLLSRIPRIT